MVFNNEFTLADIIAAISLLLVIAGGVFTYYQWRRNVSLRRANYINELTEKIRADDSIRYVVYLLDYGTSWYSEQFHGSGGLELKVDKTLTYFSYICYLKKQRIITDKEFSFFKYETERILMNQQVQDYLYNLYHFSQKFKMPFTFHHLFIYGKENNHFDKAFFDVTAYKTNEKYHQYLNF